MMSYKDLVVDSGKGLFSLANCNKIKNKFLKVNKTNPNGAVNLLSLPSIGELSLSFRLHK